MIVGSFVATDLYTTVHTVEEQSEKNGIAVNQTLSKLLDIQQVSNIRGNDTMMLFKTLLINQLQNSNHSLQNDAEFERYFNHTFTKIFKALNISH